MKQSKLITTATAVEFEVDDRLVIADPCYIDQDDGTVDEADAIRNDLAVVLDGAGGKWVGEIEIETETQGWGPRVSVLRAYRAGFTRMDVLRQVPTCLGVDSGQMYIGDAGNAPLDYNRLLELYKTGPSGEFESKDVLAAEGGIVSSTGYGDGCYPLYVARDDEGRVTRVEVRFLEDEEEE